MGKYEWNSHRKSASEYTAAKNAQFVKEQNLELLDKDGEEWEQLNLNCIYRLDSVIQDESGRTILDRSRTDFLSNGCADTMNPSLYAIAKGHSLSGVFSVAGNDVIQVRGIDVGNINFVRGSSGWIILDTLYGEHVARAAVYAAEKALNENIRDHVSAILHTFGATDLYGNYRGGARGILDDEKLKHTPAYAPENFQKQFSRENVHTFEACIHRQAYQFGKGVPMDEQGSFTIGLGVSTPDTTDIEEISGVLTEGTNVIDGIEIECIYTKDLGAPPEAILFFPKYKALWMSEVCCGTLHNIYPVRGSQIRNANAWAKAVMKAYERFGEQAEVVFQSSNWPHRNTQKHPDAVKNYLLNTATVYKSINDQTLMLAGRGFDEYEVVERLDLSEDAFHKMYTRPYYGSIKLGSRGVFHQWIGFYDGNPVTLNSQNKYDRAKQFIEYVGSKDRIFEKAGEDFEKGNYQRVAEALDLLYVVYPDQKEYVYLLADSLEQLGYQSESATFRNCYLKRAMELREGAVTILPEKDRTLDVDYSRLCRHMDVELVLDYLATHINRDKAEDTFLDFYLQIRQPEREHQMYHILIYQKTMLYVKTEIVYAQKTICAEVWELMGLTDQTVTVDLDGDPAIVDCFTRLFR